MKISKQASELFAKAIELDPEDRERFLLDECGSDTTLRDEVATLLDAADQSEAFFERLSDEVGLPALANAGPSLSQNDVVGNWRLKRIIGQGGMGAVYLAERADEQYDHQAALKTLPFGFDTDAARMRFLHEALRGDGNEEQ